MRWLWILFLSILSTGILAQEQGRIVLNPLTGQLEYVTNIYTMTDSLISIGEGNTLQGGALNIVIGYGNIMNHHSIALGWDNQVGCSENFVIGRNARCDVDKSITFANGTVRTRARMPGSVAFGTFSYYGILHVHSGYGMPNNGYVGNIGGIGIGRVASYADGLTALEIVAHYDTASPTTIINTEGGGFIVGNSSLTIGGSLTPGSLDCAFTPWIYTASGDTSLLPTPLKVGDYFINTSARDIYISSGITRGSWRKVNN